MRGGGSVEYILVGKRRVDGKVTYRSMPERPVGGRWDTDAAETRQGPANAQEQGPARFQIYFKVYRCQVC